MLSEKAKIEMFWSLRNSYKKNRFSLTQCNTENLRPWGKKKTFIPILIWSWPLILNDSYIRLTLYIAVVPGILSQLFMYLINKHIYIFCVENLTFQKGFYLSEEALDFSKQEWGKILVSFSQGILLVVF